MHKIRVTKTPKTGDQRDFSLVHRQAHYIGEGDANDTVKNTMGAVPRDEANIEVEGGETVIGDVNQDGFLEHMTFTGKRHSQGGVPVNIPEGSFIFSDTKKLKIKDKEVLSKVFGLNFKKGGYTPAEIAKKYQVNNYIQDLKSEDSDAITKRSAEKMLQNNMEKLGMLALLQESMKGFPDGVPAIAESVMAGMQGETPEAKLGGKIMYQTGGQTTGNKKLDALISEYRANPTKQKADALKQTIEESFPESEGPMGSFLFSPFFYSPHAITNKYAQKAWSDASNFDQAQIQKAQAEAQRKAQLERSQALKDSATTITNLQNFLTTNKDKLLPKDQKTIQSYINTLNSHRNNINYQSQLKFDLSNINTYVSQLSGDLNKTGFQSTTNANTTTNGAGSTSKYKRVIDAVDTSTKQSIKIGQLADGTWYNTATGKPVSFKSQLPNPLNPTTTSTETTTTAKEKPAVTPPAAGTKKTPAASKPKSSGNTIQDALNSFQVGGTTSDVPATPATTPAATNTTNNDEEIPVGAFTGADGVTVYRFYKGNMKIVKDASGKVLASAPRTDKAEYVPHQGDKNPSVNPATGKVEAGWNKSKYTTDQIDALARARGYNGPKNNKALQEWIISHPEYSKVAKELHTKYKMPAAGKEADGYWGVRWDDVLEKMPEVGAKQEPAAEQTPEAPVTTVDKALDFEVPEPAAKPEPKNGSWWLQDIVNFTGALTDPINRYEPTQGKVALQTPGYALMDPTRRLAANQEQVARMQQMTENSTDGNVGLASMMGVTGQAFGNAANVIGDVENANVGIVNNAGLTNAQIMNQEAVANETGRQKYVEDMATLNQQEDTARNMKKWREIAAFNNGTSNWFRKKQMEQVLFPDIYVDPIMGDVSVDPSGRDLFGPETYSPSYVSGASSGFNPDAGIDVYDQVYQKASATMGPEAASKFALEFVKNQMNQASKNSYAPTARQRYNQAAQQGFTLPAYQQEYGGIIEMPWTEI